MTLSQTTTPGRLHLHQAITHDGPGMKFIRAVHFWNGTTTVHRTEVLYAGDGLLLAGDAEPSSRRPSRPWTALCATVSPYWRSSPSTPRPRPA